MNHSKRDGPSKRGSSRENIPKPKPVISKNKKKKLVKHKKSERSIEKQREAVRRFRVREHDKKEQLLNQLQLMRQQLKITNSAIDAMDDEIDMIKQLIEIQKGHQLQKKLEQRLSSSQERCRQEKSSINTHAHAGPAVESGGIRPYDLTKLSSPETLACMVEMLGSGSGSNQKREREE